MPQRRSNPEHFSNKLYIQHEAFKIIVRATIDGKIDPQEGRFLLTLVAPDYIAASVAPLPRQFHSPTPAPQPK